MPQRIMLLPGEPAPGLIGFEFAIVLGRDFEDHLYLPQCFLDGFEIPTIRKMLLRESSDGQLHWWEVKLSADGSGSVNWERGWPGFVFAHDLEEGDILKFRYRRMGRLSIKVFHDSQCRCFFRPRLGGLRGSRRGHVSEDDDSPTG